MSIGHDTTARSEALKFTNATAITGIRAAITGDLMWASISSVGQLPTRPRPRTDFGLGCPPRRDSYSLERAFHVDAFDSCCALRFVGAARAKISSNERRRCPVTFVTRMSSRSMR